MNCYFLLAVSYRDSFALVSPHLLLYAQSRHSRYSISFVLVAVSFILISPPLPPASRPPAPHRCPRTPRPAPRGRTCAPRLIISSSTYLYERLVRLEYHRRICEGNLLGRLSAPLPSPLFLHRLQQNPQVVDHLERVGVVGPQSPLKPFNSATVVGFCEAELALFV